MDGATGGAGQASGTDPTIAIDTSAHDEAVAAAPAISRVALAATLDALSTARGQRRIGDRAAACLRLLRPLLTARYPDSVVRLADLDRLVAAAASAPDLGAFVAELTLDPPVSTGDLAGPPHLDDDYLVLSTVHSAKGPGVAGRPRHPSGRRRLSGGHGAIDARKDSSKSSDCSTWR